jgi:hypothetical protein
MSDMESEVSKTGLSPVAGGVPTVRREGTIAIGATAVGALALGAIAMGALAIGPQTRTCGIPASGSSRERFARGGVTVELLAARVANLAHVRDSKTQQSSKLRRSS